MQKCHGAKLCHWTCVNWLCVCSLTVNTDTETAVVNVRYAAKDQARLWVHTHTHTHTHAVFSRADPPPHLSWWLRRGSAEVFHFTQLSQLEIRPTSSVVFSQHTWFPPSKNQSSLIWHAMMAGRRGGVCVCVCIYVCVCVRDEGRGG